MVCDRDWTLLRGGQIALGIEGLALGMLVLTGLRWFDDHMKQEQHGTLCLTTERDEPRQEAIRAIVQKTGYKMISVAAVTSDKQRRKRDLEFMVQWRAEPHNVEAPPFLENLLNDPHVAAAHWKVA